MDFKILPSPNRSLPPSFSELNDKDFEDLCRAIFTKQDHVYNVSFFGIRGQKQNGIDIKGYRKDGSGIEVISCKCYKKIIPSEIRDFSNDFLKDWNEIWKDEGIKVFILAVATDTSDRKVQDEINSQIKQFKKLEIDYVVWDSYKIQELLRDKYEIASHYLHPYFAGVICGKEYKDIFSLTVSNKEVLNPLFSQKETFVEKESLNNSIPGLELFFLCNDNSDLISPPSLDEFVDVVTNQSGYLNFSHLDMEHIYHGDYKIVCKPKSKEINNANSFRFDLCFNGNCRFFIPIFDEYIPWPEESSINTLRGEFISGTSFTESLPSMVDIMHILISAFSLCQDFDRIYRKWFGKRNISIKMRLVNCKDKVVFFPCASFLTNYHKYGLTPVESNIVETGIHEVWNEDNKGEIYTNEFSPGFSQAMVSLILLSQKIGYPINTNILAEITDVFIDLIQRIYQSGGSFRYET